LDKYTLITGASQGMGEQMAHQCASRGHNILLVSLPDEKLKELSAHLISEYSIKSDFFEGDLTNLCTPDNILSWTEENNYKVNFLVNNAGFGGVGSFENCSASYVNSMIDLNVRSTTNLTHAFIPQLIENAPSFLLNNASMAANFPFPYKSVYAASKGYIKHFTIALREELKEHNISVSVLQPGATPTNKVVTEQIKTGGYFTRMSVETPENVAKIAISKTIDGKAIIIPGFKNRVSLSMMGLIPRAMQQRMIAKKLRNMEIK
jgi:short-subunit dehydrogenase